MLETLQALDPRKERLSPLDASFLYLEREHQLMHVGCIVILEGRISYDDLTRTLGRRLGQLRRYRQYPVRPPLDVSAPVWEDAHGFDPARHIVRVPLPAPGGDRELRRLAEELFATPLDPRRPLWETYLLDGYAGGRSALLCKMHHCMVDGVSGVQILEVMTDATPDPPASSDALPMDRSRSVAGPGLDTLSRVRQAIQSARQLIRGTLEATTVIGSLAREPARALPINGTLSGERRIAWATFPLDDFLAMRGAAGCKVNDVVLAVITGALRHYLRSLGTAVDGSGVRTLVPVNVRSATEHLKLGNRVSAMFAMLPIGVADPLERLRTIAHDTRALKDRGQREAVDLLLGATGALPSPIGAAIAQLAGRWPVVNTVCTNVPGSAHRRYVLGCPISAIHPLVPLAVDIGLGFAILSYGGTLSICATADAGLVPEAEPVAEALAESARELGECLGIGRARPGLAASDDLAPVVAGIMTQNVETVAPDDSLAWAWDAMHRSRIRHLPVLDDERRLVGVLTHRDLLAASESTLGARRDAGRPVLRPWARVADVMETHVSTAAPDESAGSAGRRMVRHKIGCLPVVEAGGRLAGIITEEDFMRWATEHMHTPAAASVA